MNATRDAWKTQPLPETRARIAFERAFTGDERAKLARGLVPREMEDKWFIFLEGDVLYLHRSWTGTCVYVVRLVERDGASVVDEAWVNRNPAEYTSTDDEYDARLLGFLIDRLLLGRSVPFPEAGASDLVRHVVVGHARASDED